VIVVLCGGFGAARFVEGLAAGGGELCCVVNIADDFDYVGLRVCPDLDSVLYALAGVFDEHRGWGPVDDSFAANDALDRYGHSWFHLGDRDLGLSLARTAWLRQGLPLSEVTQRLAEAWGVATRIVPATDDRVETMVHTSDGSLGFQDFAVRYHGELPVHGVSYAGIDASAPAPGVCAAIERADLLVIAPSNPISSIGPVLAVPGLRRTIATRRRPNVAVSPVINGAEPATDAERSRVVLRRTLMEATGHVHRPCAVAAMYADMVDGFVIDHVDADTEGDALAALGVPALATDLLAPRGERRRAAAEEIARFGAALALRRGEA
jgi:LPPG:FO 2-phospho-L-lactate transferase